tara:strand:- start:48123 stop:48692 length:570 start_codon:yes stop_codon:yes gene_type:complete
VSGASRWDDKYRTAGLAPALRVEPLLKRYKNTIAQLSQPRTALDVAAGACHAAVYLATQGFDVTAVDCSAVGLALGQKLAEREGVSISTIEADLGIGDLPAGPWSLVCCFLYLNRDLLGPMAAILAPGGLLFYSTFNVHHLNKAPAFNPLYLLQPGELAEHFSMLDVLTLSDGDDPKENASWIAARRPA